MRAVLEPHHVAYFAADTKPSDERLHTAARIKHRARVAVSDVVDRAGESASDARRVTNAKVHEAAFGDAKHSHWTGRMHFQSEESERSAEVSRKSRWWNSSRNVRGKAATEIVCAFRFQLNIRTCVEADASAKSV